MDPPNARCRSAIYKATTKHAVAVNKTVASCIKDKLKQKRPLGDDCTDLDVADSKTKLPGVRAQALGKISGANGKCDDVKHAATLAQLPRCPSPAAAADDAGATDGIDDFGELGACQVALVDRMLSDLWGYVLEPDADAIIGHTEADDLARCANDLAKAVVRLHKTIRRERGKAQVGKDKLGGLYEYSSSTEDPRKKIEAAEQKLLDVVDDRCQPLDLFGPPPYFSPLVSAFLGTCASEPTDIKDCVASAVARVSGGLTAAPFELAGVCPARLDVEMKSDLVSGFSTLDLGFAGLGHGLELFRGAGFGADLSCGPDCDGCTIPDVCDLGTCRCDAMADPDNAIVACDEPFGPDFDDCGGDACVLHVMPRLPVNTGGSPFCVNATLAADPAASFDAGSGELVATLARNWQLDLGTQIEPCPVCDNGDAYPWLASNLGDSGTCSTGPRSGEACTVAGVHPTFGPATYDCPSEVPSSSTLLFTMELGAAPAPLLFATECVPGLPVAGMCACAMCQGDPTVPCNSEQDCIDGGTTGPCDDNGDGVATRQPNACSDDICTDGECAGGVQGQDVSKYCDGFVRADGSGVIECLNDGTCDALDPECPGMDCGTCTLTQTRRCFEDPVVADAETMVFGSRMGSTFCMGSSGGAFVAAVLGLPGPGRAELDLDLHPYCPDGTTLWEPPGGANCP